MILDGALGLLLVGLLALTGVEAVRNRLRGQHLNVSAPHFPPTIHVVSENGTFHFSGPLIEQLNWLSQCLRFSYTLTAAPNNVLGIEENGTWTGMMGQLKRNEVDLGIYPLTVSLQRFQVLNFASFTGGDNVGIIVKYPTAQVSWKTSLEPYNFQVWMGWIVSLCAMAVVCLVFVHLRFSYFHLTRVLRRRTLEDMFIYIFGVITAQGGYYRYGNREMAVLATTWCLGASVFVYVYNCTLVSFLAMSYRSPETNSFQQLADSSTYHVVTLRGTASETVLLSSTSGPSKILGNSLRDSPHRRLKSMGMLANRVIEGPFAGVLVGAIKSNLLLLLNIAFDDNQAAASINELIKTDYDVSHRCRLTLASEKANWRAQFLGVPKTSPYQEEFNREALWAHAFGLPYKWKNYHPDFKPCMLNYNRRGVEIKSQNRTLEIRQFYSAFLLLVTGYGLGLVMFLYENIRHRFVHK